MWCADCQQDVPVVTRTAHKKLICPRCQSELGHSQLATTPSDVGISLDSFDQQQAETSLPDAHQDLAPPRDWLEQEETRERLDKIGRVLHSPYRYDSAHASVASPNSGGGLPPSPLGTVPEPPPTVPFRAVASRAKAEFPNSRRPTKASWLLSLLLTGGVFSFCLGVGLLCWSTAFQLPQLWQQGMALTIGAEGLLIISLTWMAVRLWRNGRNVNRQLHGVDRQLSEMQQVTGALAGSQTASSQHFYHHFSQSASPHMLVANLRGQVDQLAARISAE